MKHFFIIAGGKIEDAFAIEVLKGFAEKTVIAADSGMEFLRRNEIVPQVIIGDFDSVSKETLEWFQKKEGIVCHCRMGRCGDGAVKPPRGEKKGSSGTD